MEVLRPSGFNSEIGKLDVWKWGALGPFFIVAVCAPSAPKQNGNRPRRHAIEINLAINLYAFLFVDCSCSTVHQCVKTRQHMLPSLWRVTIQQVCLNAVQLKCQIDDIEPDISLPFSYGEALNCQFSSHLQKVHSRSPAKRFSGVENVICSAIES